MYITSKTGCIACGAAGNQSEFKTVGEKNTPLLKFSLAVGKKEDDETQWFNCQAWNPIATRFKDAIKKGEIYQVMGIWESREYEGKTYHTLTVQFIQALADMKSQSNNSSQNPDIPPDFFIDTELNDDDLPF